MSVLEIEAQLKFLNRHAGVRFTDLDCLVAVPDDGVRGVLAGEFSRRGARVLVASTSAEAERIIESEPLHVLVVQFGLRAGEGRGLVHQALRRNDGLGCYAILGAMIADDDLTTDLFERNVLFSERLQSDEEMGWLLDHVVMKLRGRMALGVDQFVRMLSGKSTHVPKRPLLLWDGQLVNSYEEFGLLAECDGEEN